MTKYSWNEIRQNAIRFAARWEGARDERAEAQTFWNELFQVYGIDRKTCATFEEPVKSLKNTYHRIDLFWKGTLLAEHKSAGESLGRAHSQAFDYIHELAASGRQHEIPRYIALSDFIRIVLFDLQPDRDPSEQHADPYERFEFHLADLHQHVKHFAFLIGQQTVRLKSEDEANLSAAQLMADLYDAIYAGGYSGHDLERLLVRLLFCLFADDTGIFDTSQFELYLKNRTREDGTDLGVHLLAIFQMLNTPEAQRQPGLDEELAGFPYVNGELFAETLQLAAFNRDTRNRLLAAAEFNWSRISPAIFGSLFQGIMDAKSRRQIGAHYTSERDILKLIGPLFLDELRAEFEKIKALKQKKVRDARLIEFQNHLASLTFMDPACGCGNFLVIAYRELRRLELELLLLRHGKGRAQAELPAGEFSKLSKVDVHQFFGIEIGEWPARIAETALWLTDHQMNTELSLAFGNRFQRIPLQASPHIRCANAMRMDWNELLPGNRCSYLLGNPPFVGAKYQDPEQKADVRRVLGSLPGAGLLDYVTLWYFRAAEYINGGTRCAFVSTNSITQGEQVGILWSNLFARGIKIHFAHRTFAWQSEARGKAHVHVVIVGFGARDVPVKTIFEYEDLAAEPVTRVVRNISPYLIEGSDITIANRGASLCPAPEIGIGNKPIDDGAYLFTDEAKREFLRLEPQAAKYFRPWIGADEFINGYRRWCLWLGDAPPHDLRALPECLKRIEHVRRYRMASKSVPTRKLAENPRRFHVENFPSSKFLVIPEVSSERRTYIPIGFVMPRVICSNLLKILPNATLFHFGILTSEMHMAWVRHVCGRLKSDYRYSAKLVYNNFPWPMDINPVQRERIERAAQAILDARQKHLDAGSTLADLYDPRLMPAALLHAHQRLDTIVDRAYRKTPFETERERVEFLLSLYERLTQPLCAECERREKHKGRGKPRAGD